MITIVISSVLLVGSIVAWTVFYRRKTELGCLVMALSTIAALVALLLCVMQAREHSEGVKADASATAFSQMCATNHGKLLSRYMCELDAE